MMYLKKSTLLYNTFFTALFNLALPYANAQLDTDFSAGGAVRVGDSTDACVAGIEGAIRYNADSNDTLDYCTGSGWVSLLTSTISGGIVNNGNSFSAPMVIGTNDSNTLSFETNGSTHMTIDTSGNVGIGTTNPATNLHLYTADVNGTRLRLESIDIGGRIYQVASTGAGAASGAGNFTIRDQTAGVTRILVDSSGNVGAGTNSPLSSFHVQGTSGITIGSVAPKSSSRAALALSSPSGSEVRIESTGNRGSGDLQSTTHEYYNNSTQIAEIVARTGTTNSRGALSFATNNGTLSEAMRIDENGFVGIGTTVPTESLEVRATSSKIKLTSSDTVVTAGEEIGGILFNTQDPTTTLGTTASITAYAEGSYGATNHKTALLFSTSDVVADSGGVERMRISANGNVGIGTNAPDATLDVAGDMKIGNSSATCDSSTEGSMRYNSTSKWMEFCDGSVWSAIDGSDHGFYGGASLVGVANCNWSTSSTSWATLNTADSDCNAFSYDGAASAPSEGKIPGIQFASLPSGRYRVHFIVQLYDNAPNSCMYRLYDGTNHGPAVLTSYNIDNSNLFADFVYGSTQTNHTFYIQANKKWGGSGNCQVAADESDFDLRITVEKID